MHASPSAGAEEEEQQGIEPALALTLAVDAGEVVADPAEAVREDSSTQQPGGGHAHALLALTDGTDTAPSTATVAQAARHGALALASAEDVRTTRVSRGVGKAAEEVIERRRAERTHQEKRKGRRGRGQGGEGEGGEEELASKASAAQSTSAHIRVARHRVPAAAVSSAPQAAVPLPRTHVPRALTGAAEEPPREVPPFPQETAPSTASGGDNRDRTALAVGDTDSDPGRAGIVGERKRKRSTSVSSANKDGGASDGKDGEEEQEPASSKAKRERREWDETDSSEEEARRAMQQRKPVVPLVVSSAKSKMKTVRKT